MSDDKECLRCDHGYGEGYAEQDDNEAQEEGRFVQEGEFGQGSSEGFKGLRRAFGHQDGWRGRFMGPQEFDHEGQEDGSEEEEEDGSRRAASSVGHG